MRNLFWSLLIIGFVLNTGVPAQTSLDPTFGPGGSKVISFNGRAFAHDMAIQPDNKIILVSSCGTLEIAHVPFCLVRVNEDGSSDTTFKAGYPFTSSWGVYTLFEPTYQGRAEGVVLQPDGKVIAVGLGPGGKVALIRYNSNGSLDSTFGAGGIVLSPNGVAEKAALQPDGKIVVVGSAGSGMFVARYLSDGTLDSSFGAGGVAAIPVKGSEGRSLALQPDGRVVAGGLGAGSYLLARFNSDGSPDGTWDGDGVKIIPIDAAGASFDFFEGIGIRSVGIQPDGRVVAVGHKNIIFSFNSDGSPDMGFDGDGSRSALIGTDKETYSLTISGDGRITVVGTAIANQPSGPFPPVQPPFLYYTARYNSDGSPDTTFGSSGYFNISLELNSGAIAVAPDPIGRIVIAGVSASGLPSLPWQTLVFSAARILGPPVAVAISGRVTDSNGSPIRGAIVKTDVGGSIITARTNPFGYYNLAGVLTGQTYSLSVSAKGHRISGQSVYVNNQFVTVDFIAQ
jgi:uncharacterized delta-60 repeat protein